MRDKQKTREGLRLFTGSETENLEKSCWGEDTAFPCSYQGKCARCTYSPCRGMACNLESCPLSSSGRCKDCAHLLPLDEHRRKARCRWTGERLASGDVERVRDCIGFEKRPGLDLCRSLRQGEVPQISTKGERHLPGLPRAGETFVRKSFVLKLPAGGVPIGGQFEHIDGNTSSVVREATATFGRGRGKQVLPSFFNPQVSTEVPHD